MPGAWYESLVPDDGREGRDIDVSVAHPARVYDYWLGGKDNFPADREAGERVLAMYPATIDLVRAQREFLARAVRYLAEQGIRQFLDIGTGIPAANNTHEVAQSAAPGCRVVYVDNDPMVLAHARALLTGTQSTTAYLDADLRDTARILREAAGLLDFGEPVALILIGILQLVPDEAEPHAIVSRLLGALAPGSWLACLHLTRDVDRQEVTEATARLNQVMATQVTLRGYDQIAGFFDGLEILPPGIVPVNQWRPGSAADTGRQLPEFCGLGRKP